MKNSGTWVLAMDFSEMDINLLKYTAFLTTRWKPDQIHLLHVEKEREESSYVPIEFEELRHQLTVDSKLKMEHKANTFFESTGIEVAVHVRTGHALDEVLNFVKDKSAGLVIAGRKKMSDGSGIVSDRLSGNLPCDFLLVPEDSVPRLDKIMVPTDFSDHARLAMERAVAIQKENKTVDLLSAHLFAVPWGYTKTGKTFEEFAEIMKSNAHIEMAKWSHQFPTTKAVLELAENSAQQSILDLASDRQIDLIIMESKGQSKVSYALLGSNTMKVMKANDAVPLLVVKMEGENHDFLDALQSL